MTQAKSTFAIARCCSRVVAGGPRAETCKWMLTAWRVSAEGGRISYDVIPTQSRTSFS